MWCPPKARRFTSHSLCVDRAPDANRSNLVSLVFITSCGCLVGLAPGSSCVRLVSLVPITSCGRRLFSTRPQTACRAHRFAGSSLRAATSLRMPHPNTITLYRTLLCRIRTPLPQRYTPPCHAHVPDPRSRPRVVGASLPPAEDVAARRGRLAASITTARKTHGLNCTCIKPYSMEPGAFGVVNIHFACGQWTTVNCRLNLSRLIFIFSFNFSCTPHPASFCGEPSFASVCIPLLCRYGRAQNQPQRRTVHSPRANLPRRTALSHQRLCRATRLCRITRLFHTAFASAPLLRCLIELHSAVNRDAATYTYNPSLYLNLYLRFIHISRRLAHLLGGERRSSRLEAAGYVLYFDVKGRV